MVTAEFSTVDEPPLKPSPSSLLEATPPSVVYALSSAYPLLNAAERLLGWLTWTSADRYESVLLVLIYVVFWRHGAAIAAYWAPLGLVIACSAVLIGHRRRALTAPTLEDIVAKLESSGQKYRLLVAPLDSLSISDYELIKLLLATLLLSPLYIAVSHFWLSPSSVAFALGFVVLTWHSMWFKVARSIGWRFSGVRWATYAITGIDRTSGTSRGLIGTSSEGTYQKDLKRSLSQSSLTNKVTFTFVVFENQRHWLGIGWTANLLPEERASWTDPSLNEVQSIDTFVLPDAEGTGMLWQWIDDDWRLDTSNSGLLPSKEGDVKREDVGDDMGFVYFSNIWTSPAARTGFSKYTRRRRWVRKAALVPNK